MARCTAFPRLKRSLHVGIALLWISGCGGGTGPVDPVPEPVPAPEADPVLMSPTLVPEMSRSADIGPSGGTVALDTEDGDHVVLTVPDGALTETTRITLVPFADTTPSPFTGGVVAGVRILPTNLHFQRPAVLSVEPAHAPAGFGIPFRGHPVHAEGHADAHSRVIPSVAAPPALVDEVAPGVFDVHCQGLAPIRFDLRLAGGGSAGVASGTIAEAQSLVDRGGRALCALIEQRYAREIFTELVANGCDPLSTGNTLLAAQLAVIHIDLVRPVLTLAETDDAYFAEAVEAYYCWFSLVLGIDAQQASRVVENQVAAAEVALRTAAVNAVRGASDRCTGGDLRGAENLVQVLQLVEGGFLGASPPEPELQTAHIVGLVSACARFRLEGSVVEVTSSRASGEHTVTEDIEIRYTFTLPIQAHDGAIPTDLVSLDIVGQFLTGGGTHSGASTTMTYSLASETDCTSGNVGKIEVHDLHLQIGGLLDPAGPNLSVDLQPVGVMGFCSLITETSPTSSWAGYGRIRPQRFLISTGPIFFGNWTAGTATGVVAETSFAEGAETTSPDGASHLTVDTQWTLRLVHAR